CCESLYCRKGRKKNEKVGNGGGMIEVRSESDRIGYPTAEPPKSGSRLDRIEPRIDRMAQRISDESVEKIRSIRCKKKNTFLIKKLFFFIKYWLHNPSANFLNYFIKENIF